MCDRWKTFLRLASLGKPFMGSNVALPLTGELGNTLTFSIPEFPHLSNGGIKNFYGHHWVK